MTVQELIDELNKLKDKTILVKILNQNCKCYHQDIDTVFVPKEAQYSPNDTFLIRDIRD